MCARWLFNSGHQKGQNRTSAAPVHCFHQAKVSWCPSAVHAVTWHTLYTTVHLTRTDLALSITVCIMEGFQLALKAPVKILIGLFH